MKRLILLFVLIFNILINQEVLSVNYTSAASGDWATSTNWSPVGVPGVFDDVTILNGHTIGGTTQRSITNITIDAGGTLNHPNLLVYGILSNNGNYTPSSASIQFLGTGVIITGSGNYTFDGYWYFFHNQTIDAGVTVNCTGYIMLYNSATYPNVSVINNGNIYFSKGIITSTTTVPCTFTNNTDATFTTPSALPSIVTFSASANNNTVVFVNGSYTISTPANSEYYNLTISGGGTKTLPNLGILGNFNIQTHIDIKSKNISVAGNWINDGYTTYYNSSTIVTFNGGNQTISSTLASQNAGNYVFSGTGTKMLGTKLAAYDFTIDAGVTVDVSSSNYSMAVSGNWVNNGSFIAQNGIVEFNSGSARTIGGSSPTTFANLRILGLDVKLNGPQNLTGTLTMVSSGKFYTNGFDFTMISNSTGSARIAAVPSTAVISGNFIVQRYVAAGATGYRLLTSPVSGKTLADWNDDFQMRGFPGIFNGSTTGDVSIYSYVEVNSDPTDSDGYVAATDISNPLNHGEGLWAYMGTSQSTTDAIDIDVTGPVYTGTRSISHITYTDHGTVGADAHDGWNLVGNPYVSTIDWNSLNKTNLYNAIQIWNANTGSYGVYDGDMGTSTNGVTNLIASSQGFYVQAYASPALAIPESSKSAVNATFVRTALTNADAFKMTLSNDLNAYSDEIVIRFNPKASLKYDKGDILKLSVPDKKASYIATESDGALLAFNTLPESLDEYFIPVAVKGGSAARYTIGFENIAVITDKYDVYLKDLNNEVKLDISKDQTYEFNITDPVSEKDLVLHIVSKELSSDVVLTSEAIRKDNEQVNIYSTADNVILNFDLEKQSDATITVYNLLGQQMFTQNVAGAHKNSIRLNSNLTNGIYIISVETKDLKVARKINL